MEDLAKERISEKNNYGKYPELSFIHKPHEKLAQLARGVVVNLGNNIDNINGNLGLVNSVEIARYDLMM